MPASWRENTKARRSASTGLRISLLMTMGTLTACLDGTHQRPIRRPQGLETANGTPKRLLHPFRLGREELKGDVDVAIADEPAAAFLDALHQLTCSRLRTRVGWRPTASSPTLEATAAAARCSGECGPCLTALRRRSAPLRLAPSLDHGRMATIRCRCKRRLEWLPGRPELLSPRL